MNGAPAVVAHDITSFSSYLRYCPIKGDGSVSKNARYTYSNETVEADAPTVETLKENS